MYTWLVTVKSVKLGMLTHASTEEEAIRYARGYILREKEKFIRYFEWKWIREKEKETGMHWKQLIRSKELSEYMVGIYEKYEPITTKGIKAMRADRLHSGYHMFHITPITSVNEMNDRDQMAMFTDILDKKGGNKR